MTEGGFSHGGFDALPPVDVARKAETVGTIKAAMPALDTFVLGVLAGAFIALGAIFSTTSRPAGRTSRTASSGCSPGSSSRSV